MNYSQAEDYLNSFVNYEKIPGVSYASPDYNLRHVEELLRRLGKPHLAAKTVHVAGTKGKGSVAAMIAQALTISGYKAGLYTSPHLYNLRERIRVNGNLISQAEFAALMTELKPYFEAINHDTVYYSLTFFEALTALTFVYFKQKQVDFQVLEVGLGGRLDATNTAKPEVCVITPLSLDHTEVLGDNLEKIAWEKAGIIKPGCIVVSAPQPEEAASVISNACHKQRAKLIRVEKDLAWHKVNSNFHQQTITVEGTIGLHNLSIPLLGDYQTENAATAVATLEVLASLGFNITAQSIAQGLAQIKWPGRFQILRHQPTVLVDGAHNVASMRKLVESIKAYFHFDQLFLIFGISCDKDIPGIVKELLPLSPRIILTRSSHPRAASPLALIPEFISQSIEPQVTENMTQALSQVLSLANKEDLVCVTGSLFIVAEALEYFPRVEPLWGN